MKASEQERFWTVQHKRMSRKPGDPPAPPPLFNPVKAEHHLMQGVTALQRAIDALVRVGPVHHCTDEQLYALCDLVESLSSACCVELASRPGYKLQIKLIEPGSGAEPVNWLSVCEVY